MGVAMISKTPFGTLISHYWEVFKIAWGRRHFEFPELTEKYESEFLPDAIELQETNSTPVLKWIAYLVIGMITLSLLWAILGKVDIVAIANGRIVSEQYSKNIQALNSAKVKAIYAENGQHVKRGDLLIQLDDTEADAAIQKLSALIPLLTKKVNAYNALRKDGHVSEHDYFERQKELLDATAQLKQAQYNKEVMAIISPIDGAISGLSVRTPGGVVSAGQTLLNVIPTNDKLMIEAFLNNKDIGFVKIGQEVTVKIEAYPFSRYGVIKGVVRTIAHDSIEKTGEKPIKIKESDLNEKSQTSNNYHIIVDLESDAISVSGKNLALTPGMVATAEIKTGKRSLMSYLLSPLVENVSEAARER